MAPGMPKSADIKTPQQRGVLYFSEKDDEGVRLNYKEKRFIPGENLSTFKDQISLMFDKSEEVEIVNGYEKISFGPSMSAKLQNMED